MKKLLLIIFISLSGSPLMAIEKSQVKWGPLLTSQTWSGDVYIIGDVTIPEKITLTIEEGTQIYFSNYDILQSGKSPHQSELITQGTVDFQSPDHNPIKMHQLDADKYQSLSSQAQVIEFTPYHIDTETLRQEFRAFRYEYIILWSMVYMLAYQQVAWK